jgi:hypothetical protein
MKRSLNGAFRTCVPPDEAGRHEFCGRLDYQTHESSAFYHVAATRHDRPGKRDAI